MATQTPDRPFVVGAAPIARQPIVRGAHWLGPAFVAAIAYVDPGNFATNFSGGATFGYQLLWVVVLANLMAMLIQSLSAKLGLVTGKNLAEHCRDLLPRPVTWGLWVQAELAAISTDLAEIVGGAIALNILLDVPVALGGAMTCVVAFLLLAVQGRGFRRYELVIAALLALIFLGLGYDLLCSGVDSTAVSRGLVPRLTGTDQATLAAGILGATVMPHVIYLHSALAGTRSALIADAAGMRRALRFQRWDILIALGAAGLINAAMLIAAAQVFRGQPTIGELSLAEIADQLTRVLGPVAAIAFTVALLCSGFASSSVGTYAGQVVLQGFLRRRIPLLARRVVTMAPALALLSAGLEPTTALVWSQVVLSFAIPFALVPLLLLTRRPAVMGEFADRRLTTATATLVAALIIGLNTFLVVNLIR